VNATNASPMPTPDLGALLRKPTEVKVIRSTPDEPESSDDRAVEASAPLRPEPPGASLPPSRRTERRAVVRPQSVTDLNPGRVYRRSIAMQLPRSVHRALQARAADQGTTATALILTAVNATHRALDGPLSQESHAAKDGQLFDVPQERRAEEPYVATTIRVTDAQYEALAELETRYAASRSAVITAALRLHLPA